MSDNNEPLQTNAASPSQTERAKSKEARREEMDRLDLHWVMTDPRGRRVIQTILESCHVHKNSFTGNSQTFFLEGERNIGLMLLARLDRDHAKEYVLMLQESAKERN